MPNGKARIGLVGCGRWGKYILRDLISLGAYVEVVARSSESIKSAKVFKANKIISSLSEFSDDLDGYIVATITSSHHNVVMELINRNKPIFVEKPYSTSSAETKKIISSGAEVFVMHKWRYHPGIEKIKKVIDSGELGRVLSIKATRNQWGTGHKDVNTVWIHLPHDLSIIWHFLGRIPPTISSTSIHDKLGRVMGVNAVFRDEVLCTVEHNACVVDKNRSLSVHFENGGIELNNPLADHLLIRHGQPDERQAINKLPISTEFPLKIEMRTFLNYFNDKQTRVHSPLVEELSIIKSIEEVLTKGEVS